RAIAVVYAVRLARITGKFITWGSIAIALSLLTIRWGIELVRYLTKNPLHHPTPLEDLAQLLISLFLVLGMMLIHSLTASYLASEKAQKKLNAELDERIEERTRHLNTSIEEHAKTLTELEHQRDFAKRIIDNIPAQISYLDRNLVYRLSNPLNDKIMGVGPLEGRRLYDALPGSEKIVGPTFQKVFDNGKPVIATSSRLSYFVNGKEIEQYYDVTDYPVFDDRGQIEGILILAVEVSERVEKEKLQQEQSENLRQTEKVKDEFLSVISHELRTPLNAVIGFGSLLEDEAAGPLNEKQSDFVSKILRGGDRMLALIDDLLDFARMQAGKFDLSLAETNYPSLVAETVASFQPGAEERGVRIESSIEVPLPVCLDRRRIQQVIANLLTNAIKFSPEDGKIQVRAFVKEDKIVTEVSDNGLGIAPEDLPKLFTPFKQLDMGLNRRAGGVGLGLSISKALVEAHTGTMEVHSELGKGSIFSFEIPLHPLVPQEEEGEN
ncbi:MAG TPA: PAS domain-containing sensor histidine kinase, partial [Chroococcales cyanobacterium]